jgi:tetratricopeptide (TPR) repeat protein
MKKNNVNGFPEEDKKYEELWSGYNEAIDLYKKEKFDDGLKKLMNCYQNIIDKKDAVAEEFRIAGMCLKKIGWYHRKQKDYHKAFSFHSMRLVLVKEFGSANEVHDALISLDVDVYMLKNMHLSERFLTESIDYANEVKDEKSRYMALGTTFNNLGGTLYGLNKFKKSEESILKSLTYWSKYEEITGTEEMKVPWAYFAIGDVYEQWAKHLKENNEDYSIQKEKAQSNFSKAQEIAKARNMSSDSLKWIDERVESSSKI